MRTRIQIQEMVTAEWTRIRSQVYKNHVRLMKIEPVAELSNRDSHTHATVNYLSGKIRFYLHTCWAHESDLALTITHELAHIVAYHLYSGRGHGYEWKRAMRECGVMNPQRCTSYKPADQQLAANSSIFRRESIEATGYKYKCSCKEFMFSQRRHNACRRGQTYRCRLCHQPIVRVI